MKTKIEFTRVNNDVNGNPRYVCHFLNFQTPQERNSDKPFSYELAVKRARKIGGGKFHNKQYGGGIVFQSYNIQRTERDIKELVWCGVHSFPFASEAKQFQLQARKEGFKTKVKHNLGMASPTHEVTVSKKD